MWSADKIAAGLGTWHNRRPPMISSASDTMSFLTLVTQVTCALQKGLYFSVVFGFSEVSRGLDVGTTHVPK